MGTSVEGKMPLRTGRARPRYVSEINVFEAALNRMRWLYDEFDNNVLVNSSGGKDSTIIVELSAMVARERGLKAKVQFLDQECEYQSTIDYQRRMQLREDIDFEWLQVPFKLFNATDHEYPWLHVWGEGEDWVRPKEANSVHEHDFRRPDGTKVDRFKELLSYLNNANGGAILTGMRAEESPGRRLLMVSNPMYKWVTWSNGGQNHYRFHPIWDWSYRDVWKAINEHGWDYNDMYNIQFRHGIKIRAMRVSSYHHVQSLAALDYLQEAEPETWEAATRRLKGISTQGHLGDSLPEQLPYMFRDWAEYAEYLIEKLAYPEHKPLYVKMWQRMLVSLPDVPVERMAKIISSAVIKNDYVGASLDAFMVLERRKSNVAQEARDVTAEAAARELAFDDEEDAMIGEEA